METAKSAIKFAVAPMLKVTDRHFRMFVRPLSKHLKLYTEMKVCDALLGGAHAQLADFAPCERPLAIQLGGADPAKLAHCVRLAEAAGYDEVNLNIGCPSTRVQNGQFGACLMAKPRLVAQCVAAMRAALHASKPMPITVKTRIGIDQQDRYEYLTGFIAEVASGGCQHFIIHARKAWLCGLSPKQNRLVPPLRYDWVYRLKQDFPDLRFTINGGIHTLQQAVAHLEHVDGVMLGRAVWHNPWLLSDVDRVIWGDTKAALNAIQTRADLVAAYRPYIEQQLANGQHLRHLIRPMLGLFHGQPNARQWRRYLSAHAGIEGAGQEVIDAALKMVDGADDDYCDQDTLAHEHADAHPLGGVKVMQ